MFLEGYKEILEASGFKFVFSLFSKKGDDDYHEYCDVLIRVPSAEAKFLDPIPEHKIVIPLNEYPECRDDLQILKVPAHYRCGLFLGKQLVTRDYYVKSAWLGEDIIANVVIRKKRDLFGDRKEHLNIDIIQIEPKGQPLYTTKRMKFGAPATPSGENVPIPGTDLVIKIESITPRLVYGGLKPEIITKPVAEEKSATPLTETAAVQNIKTVPA